MNNISGSTYPPTKTAETLAAIANIIWLVGIALLFAGSYLFKAIDMPEPKFYVSMKENPVLTFGCLFIINSLRFKSIWLVCFVNIISLKVDFLERNNTFQSRFSIYEFCDIIFAN